MGRSLRTTAAATAAVIFAVMPSFLVGASGVLLRADLGFGPSGLGLVVFVFFGVAAMTGVPAGRLVERLGGRRSLAVVGVGSGGVLLAIAGLARNLTHLVLLLAAGGVVNGVAQPASNLILARGVARRRALMFGIKQSAVPLATLLAGASVPLIALTIGWRWSFVAGAVTAITVAVVAGRALEPDHGSAALHAGGRAGSRDSAIGPLVALAVAAAAGMAAATSLGAFLVESATASGVAVAAAGWLQVVGSFAGAAARIVAGWLADRSKGIALTVVSLMLLTGAAGYVMLALGTPLVVLLGAFTAYAFGWGWTGLMMFAIVAFNPEAPAEATGIVMIGSAGGAAVGPLVFGLVAERATFSAAWLMAAGLSLLSASLMLAARRWLLRDRERQAT